MSGKSLNNVQLPAPIAGWKIFALYLSACLLVICFANLFTLYRVVEKSLGREMFFYAPFIFPVIGLLLIVCPGLLTSPISKVYKGYVTGGLTLLVLGLMIPDPAIAVKRIHVSEYLLLSLLLRYTMAFRLSGLKLLLFSCLATAIFGVHDEFLQGIHPLRTYGLKDMLVNGISGCGGGLLWHGLGLFGGADGTSKGQSSTVAAGLYVIWLIVAVIALVVPLPGYLNQTFPLWPFLPLATVPLSWSLLPLQDEGEYRHGITVCSWLVLPFFLYPVLVNVLAITFF